jgi:hypothetical protein
MRAGRTQQNPVSLAEPDRRRADAKGSASLPAPLAEGSLASPGSIDWNIESRARSIHLSAGLHALTIGPSAAQIGGSAGFPLPATFVSSRAKQDPGAVNIALTSSNGTGWFDGDGGIVVATVPPGGGVVVITTYGIIETAALPKVQIHSLDRLGEAPLDATEPVAAAEPTGRPIPVEMVVHVERQGDRRLMADGWVGNPGQRLRIEGFAIRPLGEIAPGDIEYMGFGPGGRQTPWVTGGQLCGTRGRGIPLTGFAVRLAPPLRDRFDVIYEGSFFASTRGPRRNGEPCLPSVADDPLAAIRLRVIERPRA